MLLPLFLINLVTMVGGGFLLLCLVVPGVVFLLAISQATFVAVDRGLGAGEAIGESLVLTKGHRGQLFWLWLAQAVVILVGLLALGIGVLVALPVAQLCRRTRICSSWRSGKRRAVGASLSPMLLVEERTRIDGVSWSTYVALCDELDAVGSGVHLTYLEGSLEIMRPGARQQRAKTLLARLIEAYAEERDLDLDGRLHHVSRQGARARARARRMLRAGRSEAGAGSRDRDRVLAAKDRQARRLSRPRRRRGLGAPRRPPHRARPRPRGLRRPRLQRAPARPGSLDLLLSFLLIDESQTRLVKRFRAAIR